MLYAHTKIDETKQYFNEILFILHDVSDEAMYVNARHCDTVRLGSMYQELQAVLDYCRMFLEHFVSYSYKNDVELFAFLLPMEKLFEEYITGFLEQECQDIKGKMVFQKQKCFAEINTNITLSNDDTSKKIYIKLDIVVKRTGDRPSIIADTKYKLLSLYDKNNYNISNADLYQMLSYALTYKASTAQLLYPKPLNMNTLSPFAKISMPLDRLDKCINVGIHQLSIIDYKIGIQDDSNMSLQDLFSRAKCRLIKQLQKIFDLTDQTNIW